MKHGMQMGLNHDGSSGHLNNQTFIKLNNLNLIVKNVNEFNIHQHYESDSFIEVSREG